VPIKDDGFTIGANQNDLAITLPRSLEIVQLFKGTPPSTKIWVTVRTFHKDDPDAGALIRWIGFVATVKGKTAATAQLTSLPIGRTLRRVGLRLCWERGCPHVLFDAGCRKSKDDVKVATTITALTGDTITVASLGAYAAALYEGGMIEWTATAEGALDMRAIDASVGGNTLRLLGTTDRLTVGQALNIYIGCDLTPETCNGVFNNLPNYGGDTYLPGDSPFNGNQVF
jgi:uncharacterized phage protein (TIGR02218 family)